MSRIFKVIDRVQTYFVEVALFFFFLARHMTLPLFQEYVQTEIYSQHGLDFLSLTHNANQSHRGDQWNDAHHESVLVVLGLQIAEGLPAIITVIILGALSDRTGRHRIMLWLPALGSCLYSFIYILIQYTGWSVDGLFLASAFRGLSGSMTAFLAGASFYAINSVKPHQRISRLAMQEFLNGGAYAVGNLMVGFWVKDAGFLRPFWFAFICSIIALLISFFLIEETTESAAAEEQQQSPRRNRNSGNCFKDLFQPMAKYFKCWQSSALVKIWLAILAFQTYAFVHIGQENTLVLYLTGQPYLYSWRNSVTGAAPWVKIGLLLSVIMAVAAIATALCTPIFQRFLSDTSIVFIGLASKAVGTLWIAIVHNETLIFFSKSLLGFIMLIIV